jgi:BMFP domain-containing protein YqiC
MVSAMLNPKIIDDLARRLSNTVPAGLREAQQDLEKNFRTVLQNTLARLDLVTREEFDVQARLLSRTREKLEALEKTIAELEARQPKD